MRRYIHREGQAGLNAWSSLPTMLSGGQIAGAILDGLGFETAVSLRLGRLYIAPFRKTGRSVSGSRYQRNTVRLGVIGWMCRLLMFQAGGASTTRHREFRISP
jgi:hypothetical protein